ncbi:probable imidazolonepropionase [Mizuhopecten yessoensis]|uniref:Probable imidazolonepropionase n=1 Tax=Mizuhopecten yessoensis TaxID=6573 RepID=A0A210PDV0_MIZYE|nr:probable imidazolonepropionase [Mizuhopecten yessoensis]OWF34675.1 imidazolonepropionase [Mizuhopecten yessoensis]
MSTDVNLVVKNARQVVLVRRDPTLKVCGEDMKQVDTLQEEDGDGISVVSNSCGKIVFIGKESERKRKYVESATTRIIDASGKCVLPGFVDAHTHPVWAGDRVHEFAMKLAGATYMEVHKAGGGIHFTVEHTRKASEEELYDGLKQRLNSMMKTGTTLVECKSGYGLNKETEVKMLKVIDRARREIPIGISSTFCGAHAVPKGGNSEDATNDVISVQLPCIRDMMDRKELHVDNIDVFCEQGVFDIDQSRRILTAGKNMGLQINFHGDELHPLEGAKMGAELGALSISHLEEISDAGISAMAKAGSIGVVLPTTANILRLKPPPVRKMIDSGMAVALGSDFNPNAFCSSMPLVMHLACVILRMSMPEVLIAATLNAAAALGKSDTHGSLNEGKCANMVVIDAPRWEHIVYQLGFHNSLIDFVICDGNVVYEK